MYNLYYFTVGLVLKLWAKRINFDRIAMVRECGVGWRVMCAMMGNVAGKNKFEVGINFGVSYFDQQLTYQTGFLRGHGQGSNQGESQGRSSPGKK